MAARLRRERVNKSLPILGAVATAVDGGRTHVASVVASAVASTLRGHVDADVLENLNAMLSPVRSTSREVMVFERSATADVATAGRTSLVARRMATLPPDERRFVGREELLEDLVESDVVWISGRAGIGKSALAVQWVHQIATALSLHRLVDASFAEYSTAVSEAAQFHLAPLIRLVVAERSAVEDDPAEVEAFRKCIAENLAERLKSANIHGATTFADLALEVDPSRALAALTTAIDAKWWDIADVLGPELRTLLSVSPSPCAPRSW